MRLITWNVNRRVRQLAAQAAALAEPEPDVVALQEVTARTWPLWRAALETIGLPHAICSLDGADPAREPIGRRLTGVLIAARGPLAPAEPLPIPWRETTIAAAHGEIVVYAVHVPNAANGWVKPDTVAALRGAGGDLRAAGAVRRPQHAPPGAAGRTVVSFARDSRGRLRPERGDRWDSAELGVVPGLRDLGFADAFRVLHGYESREPSRTFERIAGHRGGWRLDHVFASSELRVTAAAYRHEWRRADLSDHSALEADLVSG